MTKVLFLSSTYPWQSRMAEGLASRWAPEDIGVVGACLETADTGPVVGQVMLEIGIDEGNYSPTSLADLGKTEFGVVIALCARSAASCPVLPGHPVHVAWDLDGAATEGKQGEAALVAFRAARDEIGRLVDDLFNRGYLRAFMEAKRCENLILDNISDGIIAHDMERRVFFFNESAERITGYSRDGVLNRDCHDVFPGNLCGGKCQFCDGDTKPFKSRTQELDITTKSGERRRVRMVKKLIKDAGDRELGILVSFQDLTRERDLARQAKRISSFAGIVGKDDSMQEVFELIRDLADTSVPVLIQGESGTGKELVAAAIHNEGMRAGKLFVPVNCGALPESLLESELFGHVKGAFTGAIRDKKGRFQLADGGTIFLDEIGDISLTMQVKLMRVLQEGTFQRVGGEETIHVDARVISATNKDLAVEIAEGRFRDDLYYRLGVVPLWLPPLRERRNDIPLLVEQVLQRALDEMGKKDVVVSPEALDIMMSHDWPGNVRELQNWLQFGLVKCKGPAILPEHLPPMRRGVQDGTPEVSRFYPLEKGGRARKIDRESVDEALLRANGNKVAAAKLLGISRATLYRFLGSERDES